MKNEERRFIMNRNQTKIPSVPLQDVTGSMVGSLSEQGGIIRDGANMVGAVANAVVPKFAFSSGTAMAQKIVPGAARHTIRA